MNVVEIIGYILIAVGIYRLVMTQGMCPGGWTALVVGAGIIIYRPRLNV